MSRVKEVPSQQQSISYNKDAQTMACTAIPIANNAMKKPRIEDDGRKLQAFAFLQAILADPTVMIQTSNEIKAVMNRVPDPYTGKEQNVIIRHEDHSFWQTAIRELEQEHDAPTRMVVVGTPGIGKSTTALYAIRLLLLRKRRVVYVHRTPEREDHYIELTPSSLENNNNNTSAEEVEIEIHPEKLSPTEIPSLSQKSTYYIVDPGKTKTTCNPSARVAARVIIVASPDERHWGGASFEKDDQQSLGGFLRYFPMWSLTQLKGASPLLLTTTTVDDNNQQVAELYSVFGGIPRYSFAPQKRSKQKIKELKRKVDSLTDKQLRDLVTGQLNRHSGFGEDQPGGGIVAFVPLDDYTDVELKLASTSILEWVRIRFLDAIWTDLAMYPTPIAWQLLEDYMLYSLMQNRIQWNVRPCVGKSHVAYAQIQNHTFGPCAEKNLVGDCTASVLNGPNWALFYSSDSSHPLYDMIYRVDTIFFAFQVTLGKSHDVKQQQIDALVQRLEIGTHGKELRLYYAVHEGVFDHFVTKPVSVNYAPGVSVFHLRVVNGLGTTTT